MLQPEDNTGDNNQPEGSPSPSAHDQILAGLRYLAGQDPDRAQIRNDVGFNASDGGKGHWLARQERLTVGQQKYALQLLRKYRRQLAGAGLSLPEENAIQANHERVDEGGRVHNLLAGRQEYPESEAEPEEEASPPPALLPPMRDVLGPGGPVAAALPGYEPRQQQIQMSQLVADCISAGEHGIIEAGTGCGKSFGYLVPAIYARRKCVVSTGVKSLQDQLANKDVPFLASVLPVPFTATVLKGRQNYLCLDRWNQEIGEQEMFGQSDEYKLVKEWLTNATLTGDLEELPIALTPEFAGRITITSDACTGQHCPSFRDCWAEKAKTRAETADVVIVNHTLLTLDCAIRDKSDGYASVIPDRDLVILDEAHNLEQAATLAFQTEVSLGGLYRLARDKAVKEAAIDPDKVAKIEGAAIAFFDSLSALSDSQQYRIPAPPRHLQLAAENLALHLHDLARELERKNPHKEAKGIKVFEKFVERIHTYADLFASILFAPPGQIVYVEKRLSRRERPLVYLRRCPISVAEDLRRALFEQWPTICTSATLAVGGTFEYFRSRCGVDSARTLVVDSPFDYAKNALIYMPQNGAAFDPTKFYQEGSPEYYDRLGEQVETLLLASDGRAFVLFTSNRALNEVYGRIAGRLRWLVLRQGELPRAETLRQFKDSGHAVLFATRSFFEGIDVQGDALSLVVIDKIPFGAPDDPIYQARCEEITARTGDKWAWFNQLALPTAIIVLKQGFGRLIRTRTDWGVVALLDGRVSTKSYGGTILSSLPLGARTRSLDSVRTFFATHGERIGGDAGAQGRML